MVKIGDRVTFLAVIEDNKQHKLETVGVVIDETDDKWIIRYLAKREGESRVAHEPKLHRMQVNRKGSTDYEKITKHIKNLEDAISAELQVLLPSLTALRELTLDNMNPRLDVCMSQIGKLK